MAAISDHQLNRAVLEAARTSLSRDLYGTSGLMGFSEENGGTKLLGLLEGDVRRFPTEWRARGCD